MNSKILIVGSDSVSLQELIEELQERYDVLETRNTEDTIQILSSQQNAIDAIVISMELLRHDNYRITSELQQHKDWKNIPVICIGSSCANNTLQSTEHHDALNHGAIAFYSTPLNTAIMQKQLSNLISMKDSYENTNRYNSVNLEDDLTSQMQIVIKNLNCGITISHDEFGTFRYEYANDLFYSIFGYTKEEFQEEELSVASDLVLPYYYFYLKTTVNSVRTRMKPAVFIFQARKKEGEIVWIKIRCSVHYMRVRGKLVFITTYEDITNAKALEYRNQAINEKLANSEVFFQLNITDRLVQEYHTDYEDENNTLSMQNRNYQELLLTPVYEQDKTKIWNRLSYDSLQKSYYAGNAKLSEEYRRKMPDGSTKWFRATAILVGGNEGDALNAYIYTHSIDIEMKTRIAKDKIMDSDVSDITIVNIASGICRNIKIYDSTIANSDTQNRYEINWNTFIEKEVVAEDQARCRDFFQLSNLIKAVSENEFASISFWINTKNGSNVRKNAMVTYLDSTQEDLLLVGRDISELFEKEKEQQLALENALKIAELANQAKSDFLSRMSHDMRTPLNSILGLTELAEEEKQIREIQNYLKKIEISGKFLLSLINDTLDLSKIESGKMELHREPFLLEDFIQEIDTVIRPLMKAKNIQFEMKLHKQTTSIAVDRVRFIQVFYNLLSNATKYTPEGGKVEFYSEVIAPREDKLGMRFHIKDNGIGMSKEYQKVLFEPFSQEYNAAHKEQKGTGLGLSIVKQIVDLSGGNIQVISEPNKGSEFIVDLYAYKTDELASISVQPKYDEDKLQGIHILLIDDTEVNLFITQKMLELKGCIVDIAESGRIGLGIYEQSDLNYFDIILTDIRMPDMDGFEVSKRIRAYERADAQTIPIVAVTADAYDEILQKILDAGMNERLIKPIETDMLYTTIIRLTDGR